MPERKIAVMQEKEQQALLEQLLPLVGGETNNTTRRGDRIFDAQGRKPCGPCGADGSAVCGLVQSAGRLRLELTGHTKNG